MEQQRQVIDDQPVRLGRRQDAARDPHSGARHVPTLHQQPLVFPHVVVSQGLRRPYISVGLLRAVHIGASVAHGPTPSASRRPHRLLEAARLSARSWRCGPCRADLIGGACRYTNTLGGRADAESRASKEAQTDLPCLSVTTPQALLSA